MTPGARLAAAIACLDDILAGEVAERVLTRWARVSRFAGSKDRAAVRDIVFDILRQRRSSLWASGAAVESGRALVIGQCAQETPESLALFDGQGHAPPPLSPDEQAALRPDLAAAPEAVRLDIPAPMEGLLRDSLGADLVPVMQELRHRAPVDLRVNRLKADLASARQALAGEGIETAPVPGVPDALRVLTNPRRINTSRAYCDGLVELQDAASQSVVAALAPRPGKRVLDLCAGGGGKTLALAALLGGDQTIHAYDVNPRRMRDLPERARRAGGQVSLLDDADLEAMTGRFDRVMVDAPCSGTGSWRRMPDHKWRLTPQDVEKLVEVQRGILDRACRLVRPGGRVLYATCSLLTPENGDQIVALQKRRPGIEIRESGRLLPGAPGDGFYFCAFDIA
ncbi:RsmB/NOP family class I SAM-dependent RNA methyltransferase [Oceanibium sediminis]|uniref:RsmB/NOP family class I SAM-dependent RNA methyltransferase n=1 Tax=Oceanibium sediminis TaxID=2026339 RepID=UPI000DD49DDD|nr:RsmB/NOP family class I SAM-dependent RNA methyltransferase [Oceanibium sediminis]